MDIPPRNMWGLIPLTSSPKLAPMTVAFRYQAMELHRVQEKSSSLHVVCV